MTNPLLQDDFGSVSEGTIFTQGSGGTTGGGSVTSTGTTTTSTSTAQTTITLDFTPTECSAEAVGTGIPVGTKGRTLELNARPNSGFVFDRWEITTSAPTVEMTFGVFSEVNSGGYTVIYTNPVTNQSVTVDKPAGGPMFITTILNSPVTVIANAKTGYEFDRFESFTADGLTSTANVINSTWTPYADGNLRSEIRIFFRSTIGGSGGSGGFGGGGLNCLENGSNCVSSADCCSGICNAGFCVSSATDEFTGGGGAGGSGGQPAFT